MTEPTVDTNTFVRMFETLGPEQMAKSFDITVRSIYRRRRRLEEALGRPIRGPREAQQSRHARAEVPITDGIVLIGSDAHYWPGEASVGHRAFVEFAKRLKPKIVVMNGDAIDAASISRHPPIGWEKFPTVKDELDVCQERLGEIEAAAPDAKRLWPLGNHDARFETRLASVAPEFREVHGVHLKDHFPNWRPCWSAFIGGENGLVVKHRFKSGIHAPHNNTLWAGRSIVTGHLHSLRVCPFSDYNGTRFGVDGGTLADPYGPQFEGYTEDNPVNWRQGFIVLTFVKGQLLWPEVVYAVDPTHVAFRGEIIEV